MATFIQGRALVIGVGADLPNTVADAQGIAELLTDPTLCAYPPAQVTLLTGEAATRTGMLTALDQLVQATGAEDTVVVYFSGHGYRVETAIGHAYFLMPFGYDAGQLRQTAVSGAELAERLRALRARKLLLLLDCCHAGGLDEAKAPGAHFTKAPLPPEAQALLAQGSGRVAIASSRADELSYAGKPYSAFTLALAEALCGAGASAQDGYVRVADLALHAREMVPRRTRDKQHPILTFDQADNFVVAYYAGGDTQPKGLPFPVEAIEIEPEPGAWRSAIDQRGQTVHGPQTNIAGDVRGNVYSGTIGQIGNRTINTGGGSYTEGDVNISGGDFVGRNKVDARGGFYQPGWQVDTVNQATGDLHNTRVEGDQISAGHVSNSPGMALGRGAHAEGSLGLSGAELDRLFAPLLDAVRSAPSPQQAEARVEALKAEAAKGEEADDEQIASLIDDLAALAPGAVRALVGLFAPEALGRLAGGATRFVLSRLRR